MAERLRVIDFGVTEPLRSQTSWHAVSEGVDDGEAPTLSFVRTSRPYACLGFHRSYDEVDAARCDEKGWPLYRRMVGGGPVYVDGEQLCFQVSVPARLVPAARPKAMRRLLEPAVEAFVHAGVDARLGTDCEITVGDRKVCGHGAAQIGSAVVVVGNLIERFDHDAATSILAIPGAEERREVNRLMRRYVAWDGADPAVDPSRFQTAAVEAYSDAFGLCAEAGGLSPAEYGHLRRLDVRFCDRRWVEGSPRRGCPDAWRVKIRSGVWVLSFRDGGRAVVLSVVGGRVERAVVVHADVSGDGSCKDDGCDQDAGYGQDARYHEIFDGASLRDDLSRLEALFGELGGRAASALSDMALAG